MEDFKNREALVWEGITKLASEIAASEPAMMELVNDVVLSRPNLYAAVAARLARKLGAHALPESEVFVIICELLSKDLEAQKNIVKLYKCKL